MTVVSSTPTARAHRDEGYLSAGISASATTILVGAIYKYPSGVKTKQGLNSTAGIAEISRGGKFEIISFGTASVNSTTKITTLTDVRRGLSQTSTTATWTAGTGRKWNKGARFAVIYSANDLQSTAFKDIVNTFTAAQTFSGLVTSTAGISMSGTTSYLKVPSLTTTQRNALTPSNGMIVYDSTLGVHYQYISGAWATFATGTTVIAADTAAGKVDIATVAEIAAGTSDDATSGAPNALTVGVTKQNSSGAAQGNIPALNASAVVDTTLLGSGTPDSTKYLRGDSAWEIVLSPDAFSFGDASDGDVTLTGDVTITRDMHYDNLDLDTFTLNTGGFKVFARTITGTGKIKATTGGAGGNGGAGVAGTDIGGGGTGGTAGAAGATAAGVTLPNSSVGVVGYVGGIGVGSGLNGGAGGAESATSVTNSLGTTSGSAGTNGGHGGQSGTGNGGAGGTGAAAGTATSHGKATISQYLVFATNKGATFTALAGCGGNGGSGSGGGGTGNGSKMGGGGGGSGGSGGGGGYWVVCTKTATGSWTIESIGGAGGNGGNGGTAQTGGVGGGGAGGDGGAGGSGIFIYNNKASWTGSFTLTGGAGGTKGLKGASGATTAATDGADGNAGASGIALQIQLT